MNDDSMSSVEMADEAEQQIENAAYPAQNPARTKDREERKRQRRLDAREWAPRENVAVIHKDITLGSKMLTKNWNVLFVRAQTTMHMLQEIVPSEGQMEQSRGIEQVLEERLSALTVEITNERARLITLAKAEGIDEIPEKDYTQGEDIHVPIYTPGANKYLGILLQVDELFWLVDYLWLQGTIKTEHKYQVINRFRRLLWDMVKFTTTTWIRARQSLQSTQQERNAKQAAKRARTNTSAEGPGNDSTEGEAAAAEPIAAAA
ncbi:MAG: hypothetical protein A2580_18250 [Hydrogenophilales bacterium RIFOXYD1_FULL_62_11]|nr:MAG: hypothetical protein A2580_18250 [Hydrogenophilales bacterium RIFOXYD1_FULL_62_11]